MEQDEHGTGAQMPADRKPPEPEHLGKKEPAPVDRTWGKGAATALERLRNNDYRSYGNPGQDRPRSR